MTDNKPERSIVGWREWVKLPGLGIQEIKAKVDTGARTSSLHAYMVEPYSINGVQHVRFSIHPLQRNIDLNIDCDVPVVDFRQVMDSGGHIEERYVIETQLSIGLEQWPIEITLTNRETMKFRMLLGRTAMRGKLLVDPGRSYVMGKRKKSKHKDKRHD